MNKNLPSNTVNEKIIGVESKSIRNIKLLAMKSSVSIAPHRSLGKDLVLEKVVDHDKVVDFINLQNLGWKASKYENLETFVLGKTLKETQGIFFKRKKRS